MRYPFNIDTTRYKDQLLLIDWKTAEREKTRVEDLYDNPIQVTFEPRSRKKLTFFSQLAAYLGAINQDPRYSGLGNITSGAVVVIYNSGYPAMTHTFSERQLGQYWNLWCQRLQQYKVMMS